MIAPDPQDGPPLVEAAVHPELVASVIIPARNEAERLPRALAALASQRCVPSHSYEVILLINNSSDASAAIARQFALEHAGLALHISLRQLPPGEAHIGAVRRMLMAEACRRLDCAKGPLKVILSTDADSEVAPDWIAQNLREIRGGCQAVAGEIHLNAGERAALPRRVREMQRMDEQYRRRTAWLEDRLDPQAHDPWPRHPHHFASSLAVTAKAYRLVGGLPPEEQLEDVAFYEALVRHDVLFRHSPQVQVCTSARLQGRVAVGLSEQLSQWHKADHAGPRDGVDSVEYLVRLFDSRRELRELWRARQEARCARFDYILDRLCRLHQVDRRKVLEVLEAAFFGEAWHRLDLGVSIRRQLGERAVQPLASAVSDLRRLQETTPANDGVRRSWQAGRADSIPA